MSEATLLNWILLIFFVQSNEDELKIENTKKNPLIPVL
jgi:hypothetical protein